MTKGFLVKPCGWPLVYLALTPRPASLRASRNPGHASGRKVLMQQDLGEAGTDRERGSSKWITCQPPFKHRPGRGQKTGRMSMAQKDEPLATKQVVNSTNP